MNRYNIRKIFVWPAFKFGAVIGAVLMIGPAILCGLLAQQAIHALRTFLESLGDLAVIGADLAAPIQQITRFDNMGTMLVVWTALGTIIIGGLLYGVGAAITALLYNLIAKLSGGLVVGAETLAMPAPAPVAVPQPALPQPQVAPAVQPQVQRPVAPVAQPQAAQPIAVAGQARPPASPWLAVGAPPQRRAIRADRTRLGSAADNDVVIPDANPYHAEIRFENGVFVLYDMAAGQTWVNGRAVAGRNMLKEGFIIRLGKQDTVFHLS